MCGRLVLPLSVGVLDHPVDEAVLLQLLDGQHPLLLVVGVAGQVEGEHQSGQLEAELKKIRRYKLIIIDEVGYIPFDHDAANLFFQLIASRYEQGSVMVTSNLPFGRWGETFSDDIVAAAMIDRLVHHAEVLTMGGTQSCS